MNEIDASQLLAQMKVLAAKAANYDQSIQISEESHNEFSGLLKNAISEVNQHQNVADDLATRFDLGDESISISQVMIAMQKANISLQAVTQVRNRLVSAYQDIMNMPI